MKVLATLLAACLMLAASAAVRAAGPSQLGPLAEMSEPEGGYVGRMVLSPERGPGGTPVTVSVTKLPPGEDFDLVWRTMRGEWQAKGGEYNGRTYTPVAYRIARLRSDANGSISARFTAPDDFGFGHDVVLQQGKRLFTQANFSIEMSMKVSPESGPAGTPITVEVKGIGWRQLENSWTLVYDNAFAGWLSSVTTQGTARFTIPATGGPGTHVLSLIHGEFTFPYLNPEQNPRPDRPRFTRQFTVTPGAPVLPPPVENQVQTSVRGLPQPGELQVAPAFGPIGTPLRVSGKGFEPGRAYELFWSTMVGNRVGGGGFGEDERRIAAAKAGADGALEFVFAVPDDLGGEHKLTARPAGAEKLNAERPDADKSDAGKPGTDKQGVFTVVPSALPLEVSEGPAGTEFRIRLRGVGWTETANIYTLVYDNMYSGYACGFNSQGHVDIVMRATGAPGLHFIDLYPAIYKGKETRPNNFRIPQLTYAEDHPGEDLPRFRYVFRVTAAPPAAR